MPEESEWTEPELSEEQQSWLVYIAEENPQAYQCDGLNHCLVGIGSQPNQSDLLVYSVILIIRTLIERDGMDHEGALDFFDVNIAGGVPSEGAPIFLHDM